MALPDLLRPVVTDPAAACLLCDFDGTISAIVGDPGEAVALDGALEALERLAERLGCVAIISGRPAAWLAGRLAPIAHVPIELHGTYGLELWRDGAAISHPDAVSWRATIDEVTRAALAEAPPSVLVEPKGLTVGLHYRAEPTDEAWVTAWATRQAGERGLSLLTGRFAVELRPPVARDKGHAALDVLDRHQPRTVVFFGDDTGDVPVAAALESYGSETGATTVVVCVDSDEAPEAMRAVADLLVAGPAEAVAVLTELAGELDV